MWPAPTVRALSLTTLETKHGNRNLQEQQHWVMARLLSLKIAKHGMLACPNNNHVTSTHSRHWHIGQLDTVSRPYVLLPILRLTHWHLDMKSTAVLYKVSRKKFYLQTL